MKEWYVQTEDGRVHKSKLYPALYYGLFVGSVVVTATAPVWLPWVYLKVKR